MESASGGAAAFLVIIVGRTAGNEAQQIQDYGRAASEAAKLLGQEALFQGFAFRSGSNVLRSLAGFVCILERRMMESAGLL